MKPNILAIRTLSIFIAAVCAAAAQRPEIGVFVGYPANAPFEVQNLPYFNNSFSCGSDHPGQLCGEFGSAGRRPMLGLSVLIPVTGRIALRVSPLYERVSLGMESVEPWALPGVFSFDAFESTANRWELPLSARWRFAKHFNAGIGATVSTETGAETRDTAVYPEGLGTPGGGYRTIVFDEPPLSRRTILGGTAGVEFPFHARIGIVAPEIEYTRWASRHYGVEWPLNRVTLGVALRF